MTMIMMSVLNSTQNIADKSECAYADHVYSVFRTAATQQAWRFSMGLAVFNVHYQISQHEVMN